MNKFIYAFFILLFFSTCLFAQNKAVDAIFGKYAEIEGFKAVVMNDPASVLMQNETGDEAEISKDLLKGIKTIKVLSYKKSKATVSEDGKNFSADLTKFSPGDGFIEIMSVNEGRSKVKSLIRKSGEKVTEFVMLVAGETESTLIWLNGDINLQNVSNIGRLLQLRGSDKSGMKGKNK